MAVRIELPQLLADLADGADTVEVDGATVGEALHALTARYPGLDALVWRDGAFNDQLVVFLNRRDVRHLQALDTPVHPGDVLMLITALEGG